MHRTLLLLAVLLTGCSSIPLFSRHKIEEADELHPVVEVLCVWEAAEGRGLDNQPCRGFGGQVLFFASGRKEPVKVNGDVRVYVFDEEGVDGDSSKPLHQFDFPAAAWNTFLRPTNLGATYQVFVPYTRKGQFAAKCTLRVRFTPETGSPVLSRMATIPLAGLERKTVKSSEEKTDSSIEPVAGVDAGESGIQTAHWETEQPAPRNQVPTTPGIPIGPVTDSSRMLDRLRQAAASATTPDSDSD